MDNSPTIPDRENIPAKRAVTSRPRPEQRVFLDASPYMIFATVEFRWSSDYYWETTGGVYHYHKTMRCSIV